MKTPIVLQLLGSAVLWLVAICLFAATGCFHPACYAYAGTFIPLAFAFIYLYACSKRKGFGVGLFLNGFLTVLFLLVGEADLLMASMLVSLAVLSEVLRKIFGYDSWKGMVISFLPMAYTFYAYTSHWWTDTEGSLQAAVEEMPLGYAEKMAPVIDNTTMLVVMLILTIPVAILGMRLAGKVLKK
ncbi:MAG: MptD family putative ECF transporter S component [Bacteroidales bacterium]|nr:MptD family putative ECF transporter S component [Bacteroidales bacterium]